VSADNGVAGNPGGPDLDGSAGECHHRSMLPEDREYERFCREGREVPPEDDLPDLPKPDKHARFPAVEYARIAMARDLIRDRNRLGLSQQQLARLAGVGLETLSRLESGKHTANFRTVDKICKVLEAERHQQ
jgi:DNA-binding XRE family transcriptional regulator